MRVVRYPDPQAFWRDTRHFLERDVVGNTQLLAIGARHAQEAIPEAPAGFAVLGDDDEPVGAALLNNKGTLFLSPQEETALDALHTAIAIDTSASCRSAPATNCSSSLAKFTGCQLSRCSPPPARMAS